MHAWDELGDASELDVESARGRVTDVLRAFALSRLRGDLSRATRLGALLDALDVVNDGRDQTPPAFAVEPSSDLRRLIEQRALAWLEAHLDRFAMPRVGGAHELASVKALGELGLVIRLVQQAARSRNDDLLAATGARLAVFARRELDDCERIAPLVERTPALSLLVLVYAIFHRLGARAPTLERVLAQHLDKVPRSIAMMVARAATAVGLEPPCSVEEALAWTAFGERRPPWALTRAQVYETTHVIFSLTDYAAEPLPVGADYVRTWLPVWLRHYQDIGHHDLVCELISSWHCVEPNCVPRAAWQHLHAAQRPDGTVPYAATPGEGLDYHSTLMALAAALVCEHG